jgi:N-acetylglutamate synthase-like GNAT family acetyltransferase
MTREEKKLDNPVYHSLSETHSEFVIDYDGLKFYKPYYCPFGGFVNSDKTIVSIDAYSELISNFYIVGEKPLYSNKLKLLKNLVCNQMMLEKPVKIAFNEQIESLQTSKQKKDLFDLVNLVQPSYFKIKTSEIGNYFGIYKNKELIAVTGERMKMNKYTEVSAVVTHPEHTGKGYAKQLTGYTANNIFLENKIPYLHVAETNINAIALYEKLGFITRRKISFWNFIKE